MGKEDCKLQPLVSVVCMAFNQVEYIRDALDGFVNQITSFPYEVIVHDDCSTDGTAEVVMEYASRYPGFVIPFIETENQYSKGALLYKDLVRPLTRGKYIALCEGDDYWIDPDKLQLQFNFMEAHPDFSMCVHNAKVIDYASDLVYLSEPIGEDREKTLDELIVEGGGLLNPTASLFFRKSCDKYYRDGYGAPVGDHFNMMRLASFGRAEWMARPMSVYRYGAKNSFTQGNRVGKAEYYEQYGARYVEGLRLMKEDLHGAHAKAFDDRMSFQERDTLKNMATATFCDRPSLAALDGLGLRDSGRAIAKRYFPDAAYRGILRFDKMRTKRKIGTLLDKTAVEPVPIR